STSNLVAKITLPPQLDANSVSPFTDIPGTFDYVDNQHITFHLHPLPYTDPDHPQNDPNTVHFGFTAQPTALGNISVTASLTANEQLNGSANALTKTVTTTVEQAKVSLSIGQKLQIVDGSGAASVQMANATGEAESLATAQSATIKS